ncbi:hypothetical protein V5F53_03395 [Xanthobacter sp. V4C-4]|uniref:hypothetical protein n=1 Tax=Xanthobacter cornucopiae TaxID=3119924 RepID=UPI00372CDBE1
MAGTVKRKGLELDLLCRTGAGIAAIAPMACRILRELVGADAAALFWLDRDGLPEGFFHEDSPAPTRDLFVNAFEELFLGPAELNVATLARLRGPHAGHLLAPPPDYFRSNTFNLLVRASGHRHALDLRVDHAGRPRAIVLLFRAARAGPFTVADLETLRATSGSLSHAFGGAVRETRWDASPVRGQVLVDAAGETLLMMNESADALLRRANAVGQGIHISGPIHAPPRFVRELCVDLAAGAAARALIAVPSGRLVVTPERLRAPQGEREAVLVTLQMETPRALRVFEQVMAYEVSPRRRALMLAAALGDDRAEAARRTHTSEEAMKKHLAAVYDATGVRSWEALARLLDR